MGQELEESLVEAQGAQLRSGSVRARGEEVEAKRVEVVSGRWGPTG